jgi:hypothetical protein
MKILIFSQSGKETLMCEGLCIGERRPKQLIGDELKKLMEEKDINTDTLITHLGTNYTDMLKRVLNNEEVPKPKFVDKLTNLLNVPKDYFEDKELQNVLITEKGIVVAQYPTDEEALTVKKMLDKTIEEKFIKNIPIVIDLREEKE